MLPKNNIVLHMHHIRDIIWIVVLQKHKNIKFDACLIHVFLLVFDDFDCHFILQFVVETLDCLSERTLTQEGNHLPSVANVIADYYFVVTLVIIVVVIVLVLRRAFNLFGFIGPESVN